MTPDRLFDLIGNEKPVRKFIEACRGSAEWLRVELRKTRSGKNKFTLVANPTPEFWEHWNRLKHLMSKQGVNVEWNKRVDPPTAIIRYWIPDKYANVIAWDWQAGRSGKVLQQAGDTEPDWDAVHPAIQPVEEYWSMLCGESKAITNLINKGLQQ